MSQNIAEPEVEPWIDIVRQKIEAMRFGSVQIIVHEGRVTQVESTEKTRLPDVVVAVPATKKK
ncbi:MAG: YezD family protein [Verrucomicrobia bacterium]|nr:YezD family protein [Verrucomicrobiota bacterium]